MRITRFICTTILLVTGLLLTSCGRPSPKGLPVGNTFHYLPTTEESTVQDAMAHYNDFKKLDDASTKNLQHLLGTTGRYVWIRGEFEVPEYFQNQPLGLVIPYIRMAEQLYLNGNFIAQFGVMPPHERSTLYMCHFFNFPVDVLNPEGTNTILIKIWSHGQSAISTHAYIKPSRWAHAESETLTFLHSRIYFMLEGGLFFTFILYFLLYLTRRKNPEHLDFALLNVCTMLFLFIFYATEVPYYNAFPYLLEVKLTLCIPFYWMFYFISSFIYHFEHSTQPASIKCIRISMVIAQTIFTLILPNYDSLMAVTVPMLVMSLIQLSFGIYAFTRNLFIRKRRHDAIIQILGFTPVLVSILIDLIIRIINPTQIFAFITIFGWQITIIIFIIILALRYARVYNQNERLKDHLQEEVSLRTMELSDANYELSVLNEKLEGERIKSEIDLEMASLVQKKFFPAEQAEFTGWDLSVCYMPLSKVSGDLYDYYNFNDTLNGFSLFDVSGHGMSASLITMLAKNIISRTFQKGFRNKESISKMLSHINKQINREKGKIDNYLTGIICRISGFNEDDSVNVELGNAGHPYPYIFSEIDKEVITLIPGDENNHCGAIGMQDVEVSFSEVNFRMYEGDIFVCFTDGLTEMCNKNREQFGRERIEQVISKYHDRSAAQLMVHLRKALTDFTDETPWEDDLTIMVLKRKSSSIPVEHLDIEELQAE